MHFFSEFKARVQKESREERARNFNSAKDKIELQPTVSRETQDRISRFIRAIEDISKIRSVTGMKMLNDGSIVGKLDEKDVCIGFIDRGAMYMDPVVIGLQQGALSQVFSTSLQKFISMGVPVIKITSNDVILELYQTNSSDRPFMTFYCNLDH